jgi:prophage DNA circulation protein
VSYFSENLIDAQLGNVTFDVSSRRIEFGREYARIRYPYRSGQGVEDLGRKIYIFTIEAPLFRGVRESDYPKTSDDLLALVTNEDDKGELVYIDPEFGAFDVKIADVSWSIDAQETDGGRMVLTLEERSFEQDLLANVNNGKLAARGSAAKAAARTDYLMDAQFDPNVDPVEPSTFSLTEAWTTVQDALDTAAMSADGVAAQIDEFVSVSQRALTFSARDELARWSITCSVVDAIGFAFVAGDDAATDSAPNGFREIVLPADMSIYEIAAKYLGDPAQAERIALDNPAENPFAYPRGSRILVAA